MNNRARSLSCCITVAVCQWLSPGAVLANNGGISGDPDAGDPAVNTVHGYPNTANSCVECHTGMSVGSGVSFGGSPATNPDPGEASAYNLSLSSTNASRRSGFNAAIRSSGGTLVSGLSTSDGNITVVSSQEVTHDGKQDNDYTYTFSWTPDANAITGLDVGDYTLYACMNDVDNTGGTGSDKVHCNTLALTLNSDPVAVDDDRTAVSITEDGGAVDITGVLTNDWEGSPIGMGGNRDDKGDSITITGKTNGSKGTVTIKNATTLEYDPTNNNGNGSDSFTYTITDSQGATDTATVMVTITSVEDPTVVNGGSDIVQNIQEDGSFSIPNIPATDNDVADSTLVWSIQNQSNASLGTPSLTSGTGATNTLNYLTLPNQNGQDTFEIQVRETDSSSTDAITVTVNVAASADSPVITEGEPPGGSDPFDAPDMPEDGAFTPLTFNATDADDETNLNWAVATQPAAGAASIVGSALGASAVFNYIPPQHYNGDTSFQVVVFDEANGAGNFDLLTVNVTVTSVPDSPQAVDDSFTNIADGSSNNVLDVLDNDTDADIATNSDALRISQVTAAVHGTVNIDNNAVNNNLLYTPPASFIAVDTFTYTVVDIAGASDTGLVTVTPPDNDSDGLPNAADNCPEDANNDANDTQLDFDGDGMGDACDDDDDNDGITDTVEGQYDFLDPLNPDDAGEDFDDDGVSNLDEINSNSDPASDDIPPVVTVQTPFSLTASGFFTPIDATTLNVSALDGRDGVVDVTPDMPGPFVPGRYNITWTARDVAGNSASAVQQLDVRPLASVSSGQLVGEGGTANVVVTLSGNPPVYPVTINYDVRELPVTGGDIDAPPDGDDIEDPGQSVQITSGASGVIPVTTIVDGVRENDELVLVTLLDGDFAGVGGANQHTLTIVDNRNVAPEVTIGIDQGGNRGQAICTTRGPVTVTATASDPNFGDSLSFDWSDRSNALVPINDSAQADSTTLEFDPAGMSPGVFYVNVRVSDDAFRAASTHVGTYLSLAANCVNDANGDGIADANEIPELSAPHVLQTRAGTVDSTGIMQVDPGLTLRLGFTALSARQSGAEVSIDDLESFGNNGEPSSQSGDTGFDHIGGLFDFEIAGLNAASRTARIVLPLGAGLLPDAEYRIFDPTLGWRAFVIDTNNAIASAALVDGACPGPASTAYTGGLTAFHRCVRLTVEDGGPNDSDGRANGVFRDPSGVAVPRIEDQGDGFAPVSGGGVIGILVLLFSSVLLGVRWLRAPHAAPGNGIDNG